MDRTANRLVEYTLSQRYEDLPPEVVKAAKRRVVDSLGCGLAAYLAPPAKIARHLALPVAGPFGSRVYGSLVRTAPDLAAFANGVMVRYLDFNDTYRSVDGTHPSDNIPALIAVAEAVGKGGKALLAAMAVSYEVQCRFADTVPFNDKGWDQPVAGVIACALGVGKILALSRDQLHHALALAIIPNLATHQTRVGELSMWKGCATAMGARQGVFAAFLAREGMTGPHDPIEGRNGLFAQAGGEKYELRPLAVRGQTFALSQTNLKRWPVRDSCQLAVDTGRDLRAKVRAEEIESLRVLTYRSAFRSSVQDPELWVPQTRETADHSMPFSIAVTLLDGEVTPDTFSRARFLDADVLALMKRMKIEEDVEFSKQAPGVRNCRIEAFTKDGKRYVTHRQLTAEDIGRGMSDEEVNEKFTRLTRNMIVPARRKQLLDLIRNLEGVENMGSVVDLLGMQRHVCRKGIAARPGSGIVEPQVVRRRLRSARGESVV